MIVILNTQTLYSLDQVHAFLEGTHAVSFTAPSLDQHYAWLTATSLNAWPPWNALAGFTLSDSRVSCRQWFRIHQSSGSPIAR